MSQRDYSRPSTTTCSKGIHDLRPTGAIYFDTYGRRLCAECRKARDRAYKAKLRRDAAQRAEERR